MPTEILVERPKQFLSVASPFSKTRRGSQVGEYEGFISGVPLAVQADAESAEIMENHFVILVTPDGTQSSIEG